MANWARGVDFKDSTGTKIFGGVGIYGTDSTAQKIYLGYGDNYWSTGLGISKTSLTYNNNKVYHAGAKPTPAEIGASPTSHAHTYASITSKPAGLEGQSYFFNANNSSDIKASYTLYEATIAETDEELNEAKSKTVSFESIFRTWDRFSHNSTSDQPAMPTETTAWDYDTTKDKVVCTINSNTHIGFVSKEKYDYYIHEATVKSTDGDDDYIGLVIAYAKDANGREHTLTAVRSRNGFPYWRVTYNFCRNDVWTVAKMNKLSGDDLNNDPENTSITGWNNIPNGTRIKVERNGDIIKVYASPYNSTTYDQASLFTVDLNSDSRLAIFKGACQYGYSCLSQNKSTFENIYFSGGLDNAIYDIQRNEVWAYSGGAWKKDANRSLIKDIGIGRFVSSKNTKKLFYVKSATDVINVATEGNGSTTSIGNTDEIPVGTVMWYAPNQVNDALDTHIWRVCNGQTLTKADYPELYSLFKNNPNYSVTDTTFKLPDLVTDKRFIRSVEIGYNSGTVEGDDFKSHKHMFVNSRGKYFEISGSSNLGATNSAVDTFYVTGATKANKVGYTSDAEAWMYATGTDNRGGEETRPKNIQFVPLIKCRSVSKEMATATKEMIAISREWGQFKAGGIKVDASNVYTKERKPLPTEIGALSYKVLTAGESLNSFNQNGMFTADITANTGIDKGYPIREAGLLISGIAAHDTSNQIYHTYLTNRMFIRSGGINNRTAWAEVFTTNNMPNEEQLYWAAVRKELSSENLNDVNRSGIYSNYYNNQAALSNNYPIEEAGSLVVGITAYSSANQMYQTYNSNKLFIRGGGNSVSNKTAWAQVYTTDFRPTAYDIGALSTLGGKVTGDIKLEDSSLIISKKAEQSKLMSSSKKDSLYKFVKENLKIVTDNNDIDILADETYSSDLAKVFIKKDSKDSTKESKLSEKTEYSYDLSKYVHILGGALQEAINKIEELTKEISSLKSAEHNM